MLYETLSNAKWAKKTVDQKLMCDLKICPPYFLMLNFGFM